jgi:hypothetical protein
MAHLRSGQGPWPLCLALGGTACLSFPFPGTEPDPTVTQCEQASDSDACDEFFDQDSDGVILPVNLAEDGPEDGYPFDAYTLEGWDQQYDGLKLTMSYTGGCWAHDFELYADASLEASSPVQIRIWLAHLALNDSCDSQVSVTQVWDLSPIEALYQDRYGETGVVVVHAVDGRGREQFSFEYAIGE